MRAGWYERKGAAREVIEIGDMDTPEPGPGEIRVRLHASGVNPTDCKRRGGQGSEDWGYFEHFPDFPRTIPHNDGAGVVDKLGPGASGHEIGDRVWVYNARYKRAFGTSAQYVCLPEKFLVRLPEGTSFAEGACLGIPAMTAHRCLFADGPIQGKTVLVTGGAGRVGVYAAQLARWAGARVIATVSSDAKAARAAAADSLINYREEGVAERVLGDHGRRGRGPRGGREFRRKLGDELQDPENRRGHHFLFLHGGSQPPLSPLRTHAEQHHHKARDGPLLPAGGAAPRGGGRHPRAG